MIENCYPKFEEKDSAELTELLRLMVQTSVHGSKEHKELELRVASLISSFGGEENILDQLEATRRNARTMLYNPLKTNV